MEYLVNYASISPANYLVEINWEIVFTLIDVPISGVFTLRGFIVHLQCWHLIHALKCVDSQGIIHDRTPDCHQVSWSWMHGWSHNWTIFHWQATWAIPICLTWAPFSTYMTVVCDFKNHTHSYSKSCMWERGALLFDKLLSICVCTIRHWQTSGKLVQESNVCLVELIRLVYKDNWLCWHGIVQSIYSLEYCLKSIIFPKLLTYAAHLSALSCEPICHSI